MKFTASQTTALAAAATALAEKTCDAYSWDNYGDKGWHAACLMLLKRAYSPKSAEAILRSKWTRWAADMASDRKSWRYGRTNGADLARFLDTMPQDELAADVQRLVNETFGDEDRCTVVDSRSTIIATVAVHATCPHCGFNGNVLRDTDIPGDGYDPTQYSGLGAYRIVCDSCAVPFHIGSGTVHDLQRVALRLLGE